jgi:KDO2-lipid IV(A) lauroyltransferase
MRERSAVRDTLEYWMALAVVCSLSAVPLPMANLLARGYTAVLDLALPRLRRVAMSNLAMALPELDRREHRRIVNGVFLSIARLLVSFARFPWIDARNIGQWIRYEGFEHFENARKQGRGVLFATAHLGNWELSAFAHALMTAPMYVLVRPLDNPRIDALVEARRTLSGNRLIGKREYARGILKALRENDAVGILVDQNASLEEGTFVDFFGVPACAGTGFARLAKHSGATVIPGFAVWEEKERKYVLRFYAPVPITGDMERDTRELHKRLEAVIRQYPDQWLWIHRRWKTKPPAPSLSAAATNLVDSDCPPRGHATG